MFCNKKCISIYIFTFSFLVHSLIRQLEVIVTFSVGREIEVSCKGSRLPFEIEKDLVFSVLGLTKFNYFLIFELRVGISTHEKVIESPVTYLSSKR